MDRRELMRRLVTVGEEMNSIVRETYPQLIRLAHLRKESEQIIQELKADEPRD